MCTKSLAYTQVNILGHIILELSQLGYGTLMSRVEQVYRIHAQFLVVYTVSYVGHNGIILAWVVTLI